MARKTLDNGIIGHVHCKKGRDCTCNANYRGCQNYIKLEIDGGDNKGITAKTILETFENDLDLSQIQKGPDTAGTGNRWYKIIFGDPD